MSYDIVHYDPIHREQVVDLTTHLWSRDIELNRRYLAWKYEENPYCRRPEIYLALSDEKVVGMRGFMDAAWLEATSGRQLYAVTACDFVVAPEHRLQGLARTILKTSRDRLPHQIIFNLSANKVVRRMSLRDGWENIGELARLEYVSTKGNVINRLPNEFRRIFAKNVFKRLDRRKGNTGSQLLVISDSPRPREMSKLAARGPNNGLFGHAKDKDYLTWRFRNPLSRYRYVYSYDPRGELEAYLVLHARRSYNAYGVTLVDWEAREPTLLKDLLKTTIRLGGLDLVRTWSVGSPRDATEALIGAGLEPAREGTNHHRRFRSNFILRFLHGRESKYTPGILELGNWHLRMIFSDSY